MQIGQSGLTLEIPDLYNNKSGSVRHLCVCLCVCVLVLCDNCTNRDNQS